ncbi:hypothetical protein CDAR_54011 [Caerostris darwini]|uniref:Uncharacterized protein n=1 Tax=Caerostris darwini TaxID=1538125 RepID=A0AAV4WEX9_9ARAC|nr:hypothetical protein CDAR_54011 [Caerostris darwini]
MGIKDVAFYCRAVEVLEMWGKGESDPLPDAIPKIYISTPHLAYVLGTPHLACTLGVPHLGGCNVHLMLPHTSPTGTN